VPLLGALIRLDRSALFLPLRFAPFHGAVMRVRLFVVLATRPAEKEKDFLSVGTPHAASLRAWRPVVKHVHAAEEKQFWYAITVIGSGLVMIGTTTQNSLGIALTIVGGLWLLYLERERLPRPLVPLYRRYGFRHPMASLIIITIIGALFGALLAGGGWLALRHFATDPNPRRTSDDPDLQGTMGSIVKPGEMKTELLLEVSIWNRGRSPSIAKNWQLHAACGEKRAIIFQIEVPSEASFSQDPCAQNRHPEKPFQRVAKVAFGSNIYCRFLLKTSNAPNLSMI
jgi:hypothetical protein